MTFANLFGFYIFVYSIQKRFTRIYPQHHQIIKASGKIKLILADAKTKAPFEVRARVSEEHIYTFTSRVDLREL